MIRNLEEARILFLDTEPLIHLLKMDEAFPKVSAFLDFIYEKNAVLLISSITLFEISKRAYQKRDTLLPRQYKEFFENSSNVQVVEISNEIALKAAEIAIAHKLSTEESLILASAYVRGADTLITGNEIYRDILDIAVEVI